MRLLLLILAVALCLAGTARAGLRPEPAPQCKATHRCHVRWDHRAYVYNIDWPTYDGSWIIHARCSVNPRHKAAARLRPPPRSTLKRHNRKEPMARVADVVSDTVKDITGQLKEIKQSDNDDLNEIAESFDRIAERADQTSSSLTKADQALSGEQDDEENGDDEEQDEGEEQGEEVPA